MQKPALTQKYAQALCFVAFILPNSCIAQRDFRSASLQEAVTHAMLGKSGTAVVMDAASGKVMAAHHLNTAAQRVALPGSSIKPFTLIALLNSSKVTEQT